MRTPRMHKLCLVPLLVLGALGCEEPLEPGAKVDYGVADGRRGPQALSVKLLDPVPSVAKASRKPADDMAVIIEDLIKVLDRVGNDLRRGRYPEKARGVQYAALLRAVADDIEA